MALDESKVVLYRNQPSGWVAEVPSISGCYALMPTRSEALLELERVFTMIEAEFRDKGAPLPADTTQIVHASCASGGLPSRSGPTTVLKGYNRPEVTSAGITTTDGRLRFRFMAAGKLVRRSTTES